MTDRIGAAVGAPTEPTPRWGWPWWVGLYGLFAAGVVAVTWPLALRPATLWPPHHDARIFTWIMASMARRLASDPLGLFHGSAFYPFGNSLAYSELLLPPALLGLPGFLWGNPILTYNLLLLALWPLNGLAMAWVAYALTGSRGSALVAGAVFCLSPYFTEYYLEFQMLLAALLPVGLLAWMRWLETGRHRWLALTLLALAVQGLTTWYYAVILGLGLLTLALAVLCLRWRDWAWTGRLWALVLGGGLVAAVLAPFAWPYVAIHRDLRYERGLTETALHYADVTSFIEGGGRARFLRFAPSGHAPETTPFVGYTVIALAAAGSGWLIRAGRKPVVFPRLRCAWLAPFAMSIAAVAWMLAVGARVRYRLGPIRLRIGPDLLLDLAILLGVGLLLLRGWEHARLGAARTLDRADWVRCLTLLSGVAAVLALGPVIHLAAREVGPGPYGALYHVLFPLHVLRVTARFSVLVVTGLALLAALGWAFLDERLRGRPRARHAALAAVFVLLGLEYAVMPAEYEDVSAAPRPVDRLLRADPADVAVLEWPLMPTTDSEAMFRSLFHGKRLVNGFSGFVPPFFPWLHGVLEILGPSYPASEAQAGLRRIHPLRYLVARPEDPDLPEALRPVWRALRTGAPSLLRFRGTFGADDLYEVVPLPERGARVERWMSYDFVRRHAVLRMTIRPVVEDRALDQWVDVSFNERLVQRVGLNGPSTVTAILTPPFRPVLPNVLMLAYGYRPPLAGQGPRDRIGATGVLVPGDLVLVSSGDPAARVASIRLNGTELSPDTRGYNLVAFDRTGAIVGRAAFDTFDDDAAASRLGTWVAALPQDAIVAGAVRDEGSVRLTEEAVHALRTLGVIGDLRGRYREAHAFVGVRGAAPGSAQEALGPGRVEITVGQARPEAALELVDFALLRSP